MRTYKGLSQRTTNGRFLYGRPGNYRLKPCLLCLVNPSDDLASRNPATGGAPLAVTGALANATPGSLTPGINSAWPAATNGMSAQQPAGGIAVQNSGYARVDGATAITVLKTWEWGDGTSTNVAFNTNTVHNYAAGVATPQLTGTDALGRANAQVLGDVSVTPAAPAGPAALGGALQITVSWSASSGASSYNVYRSTTSGGALTLVGNTTSLSLVDTGLPAATTRYYKIAAVNAVGEGALSAEVSATTNP